MTPNEYQQLAARTEKTPDLLIEKYRYFDENWKLWDKENPGDGWVHRVDMDLLLHSLMGCTTEVGEAMDMDKKHLMYGKAFDPVNILEECGDLAWYLANMLRACGFTFQECLERNIEKLKRRFPEGFSEEKALNRNLDDERKALTIAIPNSAFEDK